MFAPVFLWSLIAYGGLLLKHFDLEWKQNDTRMRNHHLYFSTTFVNRFKYRTISYHNHNYTSIFLSSFAAKPVLKYLAIPNYENCFIEMCRRFIYKGTELQTGRSFVVITIIACCSISAFIFLPFRFCYMLRLLCKSVYHIIQ